MNTKKRVFVVIAPIKGEKCDDIRKSLREVLENLDLIESQLVHW